MMNTVLVLNGPNLNRLGLREPAIYGCTTLATLNENLAKDASLSGITLRFFQSNHEGELIDAIHQAADDKVSYFIVNAAAFTHTSIAIREAIQAVSVPFYEVHISNIFAREPFRHYSYLSGIAEGIIAGFGIKGYFLALNAIIDKLNHREH